MVATENMKLIICHEMKGLILLSPLHTSGGVKNLPLAFAF